MHTARRTRLSWLAVPVVVIALVYSWIASDLRSFTDPIAVMVAIPIVIAGIAVLRSRRRPDVAAAMGEPVTRRGTWVWVTLIALLLAWELISYGLSPRVDHPTLSSIADAIMEARPRRFVVFVAWLAFGYWLFRR
jgi:hypothetical protein